MDLDATTSTILSVESDESMRGSVSQTVDLNFHTHSQMSEQQAGCARSISAQAEVLGNEDLLGVLFASAQPVLVNVEETMPSSWAARDILRIALTCKNFYEPAISVLWRSMISWAPLLRLIPSVVQREGIFTTDSPIMVEDLSRFNFYAKRIQHFNLTPKHAKGKNSLPVSSHLGALLAHHRRLENILFPVLQTLTIDMSSMLPGGIPILFLLPPAALKDVRLKWTNPFDRHVASSFINVLSQLSPALSCLHLEGYLADGTLDVRRVHDFKQLREVSLKLSPEGQNMTAIPDLWSQLTNLQHLTTLCLSLPGSEYLGQFYAPCVFNSLDTFNIKGPMDSVVVILRLIKVSHLLNFNLTLDEASPAGLSRMKTLLPASLASLSIHSVCVDAIINFSPDIQSIDIVSVCAASIIPNAFFAKFSSISRLRKLSICLEVINFLFVESLHSAKWKWPNLQDLHFYPRFTFPNSFNSALSLAAVVSLVGLFPDLKCLSVPTFFNTHPKKLEVMETRMLDARHYHLRELHLTSLAVPSVNPSRPKPTKFCPDYSDYSALLVITQFIDHQFPQLDVISAESWYIDTTWLSALEKGVMAFQKARRRGRETNRTCCNDSNGLNDSKISSASVTVGGR